MFVRAEIYIIPVATDDIYYVSTIKDEFKDHVRGVIQETFRDVQGVYIDNVNWSWLYANDAEPPEKSNSLQYRTPHSNIDIEITL